MARMAASHLPGCNCKVIWDGEDSTTFKRHIYSQIFQLVDIIRDLIIGMDLEIGILINS